VEFDDAVRGPQCFNSDDIGDFIIRRSDGTPAFFFTNAIDDALMGVTHVLRGEDHLTNTPRQLMILAALNLSAPTYGHLSLLVGADGSPLSKRHGSRSVRQLREEGYLPGAILNYLARLGHTYESDRYMAAADLAAGFSLQRLGRAPARYDEAQLRYWQKEAVASAASSNLVTWFTRSNPEPGLLVDWDDERLETFIEVIRENIEMPSDIAAWLRRLCADALVFSGEEAATLSSAGSAFFRAALDQLDNHPDDFRVFARAVGEVADARGKGLFMPLRVALTGVAHGPEMARVWNWLGTDVCRKRLQAALDFCNNGNEPHAETV
jgi:glutamyl-tRNA synthetase